MKESDFIAKNKDKWLRFEQLFEGKAKNPNELSRLFIDITDDLSYARTFYPNRSVRVYLNGLAKKSFAQIYKNRRVKANRFVNFWREELPLVLYASRIELFISLIVFVLSMAIGVISTHHDSEFPALILGPGYVAMTEDNINNDDPMAVYKGGDEADSFLRITINNIRVAFIAFISGVLSSLGTLYIMIYNGIMVGTFQYFFYQKGLFLTSFLTIWIHGALEISAIVIAGGAGIAMGRGLLFPGTYGRLTAFRMSAKRGMMIVVSLFPVFITAGFLESFVTGHTELPDAFKVGIIVSSFLFIFAYYVWYPRRVAKGQANVFRDQEPDPQTKRPLVFYRYRDLGAVFTDAFEFYRQNISSLFTAFSLAVLPLLVLQLALLFPDTQFPVSDAEEEVYGYFSKIGGYYVEHIPFYFVSLLSWTSFFTLCLFFLYQAVKHPQTTAKVHFSWVAFGDFAKKYAFTVFLVLLILKSFALGGSGLFFFSLALLPLAFYFLYAHTLEEQKLWVSMQLAFKQLRNSLAGTIGVLLMLTFVTSIYYAVLISPAFSIYTTMLDWHITDGADSLSFLLIQTFYLLLYTSLLLFALPLLIWGIGFQFLATQEYLNAQSIQTQIDEIGTVKKWYEG